jgi:anti-sigma regulatory factor (Ser/Thr protein kinase)
MVEASTFLPRDLTSAAIARRFVGETVRAAGLTELEDAAVLAADELVANGLLHARTGLHVRVCDVEGAVRIEVLDGSVREPKRRQRLPEDAEQGRGLHIVDALARAWGSESRAGGKLVWCELPVSQ